MQRLSKYLKLLVAFALSASLLSGCGSQPVSASYPLESVTQNGAEASRVYRAENKTVPKVAQELAEQRKPQEISKENPDRMFLVYPDEWYHLQKDPQKPSDTIIEVDSKEFVLQNYAPSFLEGYIVGSVLSNLFDSWKRYPGTYRGYTSKDIYKPSVDYRPPTAQEKKAIPPITVERGGSIIKRSDKPSGSGTSIGADGNVLKKSPSTTVPRNNSPPKTRVGGFGKITKRR